MAAPGKECAEAHLDSGTGVAQAVRGIELIIQAASDYIVVSVLADVLTTELPLREVESAGVGNFCNGTPHNRAVQCSLVDKM